MNASDNICIQGNPDISGIGVRTAIYAQNLLSFAPALFALRDGKITRTELEGLETQSRTILITAFAILVSAIVQAFTGGITNLHASIILNLSWMNNTNLFIYLLLYFQHRTNLTEEELREEVEEMVGAEINRVDPILQHRWRYEAGKLCRNLVVIVGSVHLSLMAIVGIWLWSNPAGFGESNPCSLSALISVFGIQIPLHSRGLKIWSMMVYSVIVVPMLNLAIPMAMFEGLLLCFQKLGQRWWHDKGRHYKANTRLALGILAIIDIVLLFDTEMTLQVNQHHHLLSSEAQWTFGQTLALLLLLVPLRDLVESLLEQRASTLGKRLYNACRKGKAEIAKYVLDLGAKSSAINSSIRIAIERGFFDLVELLLQYPFDVNAKDQDQKTLLQLAAESQYLDIVKLLIKHNADVNAQGDNQWTPLHWAIKYGYVDIVKILIDSNVNLNTRVVTQYSLLESIDPTSPLQWASLFGHLNIVQLLIEHNSKDVNQVEFCWAAITKNLDIVKLFIKHNAQDENQWAFHWAARNGDLSIVKLLIEHNVDLNATNAQWSLLHWATVNGHFDIVKLMIKHNVDISGKDTKSRTPLHLAAENGNIGIVRLLIKYKADVNLKDDKQWTPLHWAATFGHLEIVSLLIKHNADFDAKDNLQRTALDLAAENRHQKIVLYIKHHMLSLEASLI